MVNTKFANIFGRIEARIHTGGVQKKIVLDIPTLKAPQT